MIARITEWFKTDRRRSFALIGALAIVLVVTFLVRQARQAAAASSTLQTATVERSSLVATVGATGSVRAIQSAALAWGASGIVEEVAVAVGDTVRQGQILAMLQQTSLPQSIILAHADLQAARDALEDFENSFGELGIAQAQKTLADAQDAFERAQRYFSSVSSPSTQVNIDSAQANLVLAEDQLNRARDNYAPYANRPEDDLVRANMLLQLTQAQQNYDAALRQYNSFTGGSGGTTVTKAEADLALAQAQLAQAQKDYDAVLAGPTAQQRAAAEARLTAAQATLKMAYIEAPFTGTVTDIFPNSGDLVNAGAPAVQIDNLDKLQVVVEVSEVDINRVHVGQPALVTLDAVSDAEYHGTVIAVALTGSATQGAVNFRVTVELDDVDEFVRPGMIAAVNIVITEIEDALVVPNRAVRVNNGQRVVYVLRNGRMEMVTVSLGASSEVYSEVLSGLSEGETIVLNPPSNLFSGPPNGGGFMMGGGN